MASQIASRSTIARPDIEQPPAAQPGSANLSLLCDVGLAGVSVITASASRTKRHEKTPNMCGLARRRIAQAGLREPGGDCAAHGRCRPKQLDRFRDRFSLAGAKDDRRDAWVLADALRIDGRFFRRLDPVEPEVAELREWTRIADELIAERTRLVADPPIRRGRFRGAGDLQQPKPTYTRDFGLIFVPPARNSAANGATNAGPSTEP